MSTADLLALTGLHKHYGGVRALDGASLRIARPGVVHGLIGANGSGKSTLLGILSGQVRPDAGRVAVDGREVHLHNPAQAVRHGVAMVSQETALAPALSIAENVYLGGRFARRGVRGIDWRATEARAAALLGELGVHEDPATPVGTLRPDRQQMVEIARAISLQARILILDEPTSSLDDEEVEALTAAVRRLRDRGVAVILVSHRLGELIGLCDELTVLRDGRTVAAGPVAEFDAHRIVDEMVGHAGAWSESVRPVRRYHDPAAPAALRLRGVTVPGAVQDVDLDVAPGEVVGLAGMVGSGRSRLVAALFGQQPVSAGAVTIAGRPFRPGSPRAAIDAGVGYVPPDRRVQGLVLLRTVAENLAMVATRRRPRLFPPGRAEEDAAVRGAVATMNIRAASPHVAAGTLSGGNQQKVALGKWTAEPLRVLLLDEPTRGVDVAAKAEIHALLRDTAARGTGLLVSSGEHDELVQLCDTVVVLHRGRVTAVLRGDEISETAIAHHAGGST